jgi:hypothetical protein
MIVNGTSAAALVALVRYLACELGPLGITANVVPPGMIDTGAGVRAMRMFPPGFKRRVVSATPLGRVATPEDVARVIAFFASNDSGFMTGTVGHVNGGFGIARLAIASEMNAGSATKESRPRRPRLSARAGPNTRGQRSVDGYIQCEDDDEGALGRHRCRGISRPEATAFPKTGFR